MADNQQPVYQQPPWNWKYIPEHMKSAYRLVFLDIETTGLDENECSILEIACVVTDKTLTHMDDGLNIVIGHDSSVLSNMEPWCMNQHVQLARDCASSKITVSEAESTLIEYLSRYITDWSCLKLAGNNIEFDKKFLKRYMPKLNNLMPAFSFDISSVRHALKMWTDYKPLKKKCGHRALDDVWETIQEAKSIYDFFNDFKK